MPIHPTWSDLRDVIRATGRYDASLIMRMAHRRAAAEFHAGRREGLTSTTYRLLLAEQITLVWIQARQMMAERALLIAAGVVFAKPVEMRRAA